MQPVLTASEVRQAEVEWARMRDGSTWPLMVKAAQSFVRQFDSKLKSGKVLIVTGKGNNGGDGYYIGKLLLESGLKPVLWAPLGKPKTGIDAEMACREFEHAGGVVLDKAPAQEFDYLIDAVFGSGLDRALTDDIINLIHQLNAIDAKRLCVDVPSGLNADTGLPLPVAVQAFATHSFIALKPGLLTGTGTAFVGELTLDSLGVESTTAWQYEPKVESLPERSGNTHKAEHGNVRVIGGRLNMGGAAVLTAKAALFAGAGRVFVHCDEPFFAAVIAQAPELMTANDLPASAVNRDVLIIGPGLGRDDEAKYMVSTLIENESAHGVLDADGLYHLSRDPQPVANWVLTPHEAEAARLLDWKSEDVRNNRIEAVQNLARKYQTTVVLKGAGTLVANQSSVVFCHPGAPAMATPGMGDCLAGILGSLLAQGLSQRDSAIAAVNWHAILGKQLASDQRIVLASDIIQKLKLPLP